MNKRFLSKFVALLLSITLALSIVGCTKTPPNTNENKTEVSENTQEDSSSQEESLTEENSPATDETETTSETSPSSKPNVEPETTVPSTEKTTEDTPTQPETTPETTPQTPSQPESTPQTPTEPESTPSAPSEQTPSQSDGLTFTEHSYDDILYYTAPITTEEITGVRNVLTSIITTSMSDIEKIKAVHDWLVKNTTYEDNYYDRANYSNFVYNLIFNKVAVCQGYTVTFYVMLTELNIPCTIVSGTAGGELHAWNAVKLDGYWYYVDVTWGDPKLNGTSNYPDGSNMSYQYLLCTYETISKDHTETPDEYAPTNPTPNGTSNSYNDKMYELSGVTKLFRMNSMDEAESIAAQITGSGKYVVLLENSALNAEEVYNAIVSKLNLSLSASLSNSCITFNIS